MMIQTLRRIYGFSSVFFSKSSFCAMCLGFVLAGCAGFGGHVQAGDSEDQVIHSLGRPYRVIQDGQSKILEYKQGFGSQYTYFAHIGPDNRLVSYEEVATNQKFASIQVGKATKDDVLRTIGTPYETSYLPLKDLEVWSYPYKESGNWDSVMHVHFDKNGIVQSLQNGPDMRFDRDGRFGFGFGGGGGHRGR